MLTRQDFEGKERPTWCPGCGNHAILNGIKMALVEQNIAPHQAFIVTGVGCGSKLPHYMKITGFHTLHGRTLTVATGARLANHGLPIIAVHGDGDGYGEGLSHFLNTVRRNLNIVDVVQDNRIYGLTKGQYSPTSEQGKRTPTSPHGAIEQPVQPLALAITAGATFVARGYSGELKHLAWLIGEALQHPGYALVDVLQPCVTFNRNYAYDFYNERVYKLEEEEGYDPSDRPAAWQKAFEWGDRIPIGIVYRSEPLPTYEEQIPALQAGPLVDQPLEKLRAEQFQALQAEMA
ncbi:MAG TPA: 2-oxoacid:ferredoxin oxidoreductase subunit beta [Chloroflexi bacterium]|nr:2-oxoacid:ferredoxin oxidoreductase subunit beta [Chloroflexota bacterium]